jgi:hypothetical protein
VKDEERGMVVVMKKFFVICTLMGIFLWDDFWVVDLRTTKKDFSAKRGKHPDDKIQMLNQIKLF